MSKYILAIDQGTTGTTAVLVQHDGSIKDKVNKEFRQIFPKPGWVEHNADEIWQSVTDCIAAVLEKANVPHSEIAAIGITNQRETCLVWDKKTGKPIHNAIVWQCRRTTDFCAKLKKDNLDKLIRRKTGLVTDPYFSGSKLRWILKNVPGAMKRARAGELLAGTIDTYLLWKLTNGQSHKTEVSNASRTMLMNLKTTKWDKEMLKIFSVPEKVLPEICASNSEFGTTQSVPGLHDGIRITGIVGDQQAALFGQLAIKAGEAKCTFGTGSFILMNTGDKPVMSKTGLLSTLAWQLEGKKPVYALEGGAFICGAAVQWLRDGLQIINSSPEVEALAKTVDDSEGVEFVPALAGLGAPHWDPEARGVITGLTRGTHRGHIALATLEAMSLQNVEILRAMEKDLGKKMRVLRVDGGAVANSLLLQIQSDHLGVKIQRPKIIETTAAGAAYMAGIGSGFWKNMAELKSVWQQDKEFSPKMTPAKRKTRMLSWQRAVKAARI